MESPVNLGMSPAPDKSAKIYFWVGLFIALCAWGLPLIGVAVNVWLGGAILAIAFFCMVRAFWMWEKSSSFHIHLRIGTIVVAAILYFRLAGRQIINQYRLDHPKQKTTKQSESKSQPPEHQQATKKEESKNEPQKNENPPTTVPQTKPKGDHPKKVVVPRAQSDVGFHESTDVYFFTLGENGMSASATVAGLRKGQKPFVGFPITVFAKDTDNKIHYRISIWNGFSPVEVTDDEFSLHEPFWDRNFDKTALEIVDEKQNPVLQVMWKTPTNLVINGIFRLQNGSVVIADSNGWRPMKPGDKIKPLFKYPSRRFQGQYADQ